MTSTAHLDEVEARIDLLKSSSASASEVFSTILTRSPISRADIARRTGLSQAAVTKAVAPLVTVGLVTEEAAAPSKHRRAGRPATPMSLQGDALVVIGIKVVVDEVVAVATDLQTQVLHAARAPISRPDDPEHVMDVIEHVHGVLLGRLGALAVRLAGVGVAISGDVDVVTGVVRESTIMRWQGVELGALLTQRLGMRVVVRNDVSALAVLEHWFGVGLGSRSFAIVTIGSGIGGGLHVNGDVVEGHYGVVGEIGHAPLGPPDLVCVCGRYGCVEAVASAPAIVKRISTEHGREIAIAEAVTLAHEGDPCAIAAFGDAAAVMGKAIAVLATLIGPECVIIGGEAVRDFDLFDSTLRASFEEHVFGSAGQCRIVLRPHSFEDWARGAAATVVRTLLA